jgi:hypothetical protein
VSVANIDSDVNAGERGYVGYEMWLRDLETRAGGIVGASGCFFASRVQLYDKVVPNALSRDFAAPLIAREHGYRSVSVREAVCYVPRSDSLRREYRRKVRTMTRGLETLYFKGHLLNPIRFGRFAWMLASHKLIRWLVPLALLPGCVGGIIVVNSLWGYLPVLVGIGAVSLTAAVVLMWPKGTNLPLVLAAPGYVVLGVVAGLHAWINVLRGGMNPVWKPTRRESVPSSEFERR